MDNRIKYSFGDFTLDNYRNTLKVAKKNKFRFSFFHEPVEESQKTLLWRHDVEFCPFVAMKMAEIEAEEGVRSTFFFQMHGELYNVLEKEVSDIVVRIRDLGHDIGLHFDSHYYNISSEAELDKFLELDKNYFNAVFKTDITAFSFHNTNAFILSCQKKQYAGLLNVYAAHYRENFRYCADSTGFWRYERLTDVLSDPTTLKLQVLTHDAMWSEEVLAPRRRVFSAIENNSQRVKKWYDATLLKFGALNIDDDVIYK